MNLENNNDQSKISNIMYVLLFIISFSIFIITGYVGQIVQIKLIIFNGIMDGQIILFPLYIILFLWITIAFTPLFIEDRNTLGFEKALTSFTINTMMLILVTFFLMLDVLNTINFKSPEEVKIYIESDIGKYKNEAFFCLRQVNENEKIYNFSNSFNQCLNDELEKLKKIRNKKIEDERAKIEDERAKQSKEDLVKIINDLKK